MRRKTAISIATLLTCAFVLSGCGHEHTWVEATCTTPRTCSECNETEGEPLGHTWIEATCTEAKTCSVCGATEGEPLGHDWIAATYEEPMTCSVCGLTEGTPLEETIEHYITEVEPDIYQQFVDACANALENNSNLYCDVQFEVHDNSFVYKYLFTEELSQSALEKLPTVIDKDRLLESAPILKQSFFTTYNLTIDTITWSYLTYDGNEIISVTG